MDKLMVLDGDFDSQLGSHLSQEEKCNVAFALEALISNESMVFETHMDYLRSGAQIIRTNTYRASTTSLRKYMGLAPSECSLLIKRAVKLAKLAVLTHCQEKGVLQNREIYDKHRPLVAGCCGSYNASNFYDTKINISRINVPPISKGFLLWFHEQRVLPLLEAGVDLLAFESIPSMKETEAIIELLKKYPTTRAWITFLCPKDGKLVDGSSFLTTAMFFYDSLPKQIIAVGAECDYPEEIRPLMRMVNLNRKSKIPFLLYADKDYSTAHFEDYAGSSLQKNFVHQWLDAGVRYIGGGNNVVAENKKYLQASERIPCPC